MCTDLKPLLCIVLSLCLLACQSNNQSSDNNDSNSLATVTSIDSTTESSEVPLNVSSSTSTETTHSTTTDTATATTTSTSTLRLFTLATTSAGLPRSDGSKGGVGVGDYDRDGWEDLYIARRGDGENLLFRNLGSGQFEEVGSAAGVGLELDGASPTFVDINQDGWLDILLGSRSDEAPVLFLNQQDGTFSQQVIPGMEAMLDDVTSIALGDYDHDQDLDILMAHWGIGEDHHGYLWENDGSGQFQDVSETMGVSAAFPELKNFAFASNFADINNDGWLDILMAVDFGRSQSFLNREGAAFEITTTEVISDEHGMGASVADYDNDGDLDWFVTSIYGGTLTGNRFYQNQGDGSFLDVTDAAGVRDGGWGWASCFADMNNDGHLDLFHVNGRDGRGKEAETQSMFEAAAEDAQHLSDLEAADDALTPLQFIQDPVKLFMSQGDGSFEEQAVSLGVNNKGLARGVVCFDYDRDGDIDLFFTNFNQPSALYQNIRGNENSFLSVKLEGQAPNLESIGARVYAQTETLSQMREIRKGNNYVSHNSIEAHFGLGESDQVSQLRVVWPDQVEAVFENVEANQFVLIRYPDQLTVRQF